MSGNIETLALRQHFIMLQPGRVRSSLQFNRFDNRSSCHRDAHQLDSLDEIIGSTARSIRDTTFHTLVID